MLSDFLGAPRGKKATEDYENAILDRRSSGTSVENAVDYQYRHLDRQINKARGLLTYNGLLFAAFSAFSTREDASWVAQSGSAVALVACVPLIFLFIVFWGPTSDFASGKSDFRSVCRTTYWRSPVINLSALVSLLATGLALGAVLGQW